VTITAPKIERHTAADLLRGIREGLPDWAKADTAEDREGRRSNIDEALMQIAARFGELIINRLNHAPEKNFLAFLDLLGVGAQPMEAARVPITFYLTPGAQDATVPEGTQVAAPPPKGDQRPVIFETEQNLFVTSAKLDSLFTKSGQTDRYTDLTARAAEPPEPQPLTVPACPPEPQAIPHLLYVALPLAPTALSIDRLTLKFALEKAGDVRAIPMRVQWEVEVLDENAAGSKPASTSAPSKPATRTLNLTPSIDGTNHLTQPGDVVFLAVPKISPTAVEDRTTVWMCCRLLTPLSSAASGQGTLHESQLPLVKNLSVLVEQTRKDLPPEQGFWNATKLDLMKESYPFGDRPKLGETFYFAHREAFSNPDAKVTIHVDLARPGSPSSDPALVAPPLPPETTWEFWNGNNWEELGVSGRHMHLGEPGKVIVDTEFVDNTLSFTKSSDVSFRFSRPPLESSVNGVKNFWIRVRISSGDYGRDAQLRQDPSGKPIVIPATLAPPVIGSISIDYDVKKESIPAAVIACNDFECKQLDLGKAFKPFSALTSEEAPAALYFGFTHDAPANQPAPAGASVAPVSKQTLKFPAGSVSVYVALADVSSETSAAANLERSPSFWDYWNGSRWEQFPVPDQTQRLRRSGIIHLLVPPSITMHKEFGQMKYWVRMRLDPSATIPNLFCVRPNTTLAVQGLLVTKDILGSSTGKPRQKFRTTQPMVLPGQKLEVREPTMPPKEERASILREEGHDAIRPERDAATGKRQFWVTWHEVANFYGSDARDRHYILDHVTGEVMFGDGESGMLPPVLDANVRLIRYRSGGGTRGNLPPRSINQLVTAVPYVQKATNWISSSGGTDPETNDSLLERGPRMVRHRGRAVTVEDYEDLARLASREVARAKCVPLYDLKADPDARRRKPGRISLILVPNSSDPKPAPSTDLFDRVLSFLDTTRSPMNELVLVGPEYVRVDVSAEILVSRPDVASQVQLDIAQALERYLHPVKGGSRGTGWDYGRFPQRFDLCVLMEQIPGVNHVRNLQIHLIPDRTGADKTGRSLIYNGRHDITVRFEDPFAAELTQSR
jgi:hypothetical protein